MNFRSLESNREVSRNVPKLVLALSLAFFALNTLNACKGDGDVLAAFKGGDVKRGELRTIFQLQPGADLKKVATIKRQDQILRQFSMMKMAAIEAKALGLDKETEYKQQIALLNKKVKLDSYKFYLRDNADNHKYEMVEIQFLFLKQPVANPKSKKKEIVSPRDQEALELLAQLNKLKDDDSKIEEIITKKTEKAVYKAIAGYQIPMCKSCTNNRSQFLLDPLKKAKGKEFVHIPNVSGGHWLVRRVRTKTLTGGDLESYLEAFFSKMATRVKAYSSSIQDPKQKARILQQIPTDSKKIKDRAKNFSDFMQRSEKNNLIHASLKKAKEKTKFKLHDAANLRHYTGKSAKTSVSPETPLFDISGKTFTYAELSKEIPLKDGNLNAQFRGLHMILINYEVLKDEADFKKSAGTNMHDFLIETSKNSQLSSMFFRKQMPEVKVPEAKIKEWYTLRKNNQYKGKSLSQVRKQIERQLMSTTRNSAYKKLQSTLNKKYELKINRDKLKEGEL